MTREEFNTYLKDWQVWRVDPNRKLPSKLFDRQRRKAYVVFNETFFTGQTEQPVTLNPVQHVGVVAKVTDSSDAFRSTAASQWSTIDAGLYRSRKHLSPVQVHRNPDGTIRGISWNTKQIEEQLNHWRWLLSHPRLIWKIAQRSYVRRQRLQDSALFL
jgi:hypothetical protein